MPPSGENGRIQRLEEDCARLKQDMYYGNGLPGLTTRMRTAEDSINALKDFLEQMKTQRDTKMNLILGGIVSLLVGMLLVHLKVI